MQNELYSTAQLNRSLFHKPDSVDKLLSSYQFEEIFHTNLYSYYLNHEALFNETCSKSFSFHTIEGKYSEFIEYSIHSKNLPCCLSASYFLDYVISSLGEFPMYEKRGNYLTHYKYPDINSRTVDRTPNPAEICFTNYLTRTESFFKILTDIYVPLLEQTFFFLFHDYIIFRNQGGEQYWVAAVDNLYDYVNNNINFFSSGKLPPPKITYANYTDEKTIIGDNHLHCKIIEYYKSLKQPLPQYINFSNNTPKIVSQLIRKLFTNQHYSHDHDEICKETFKNSIQDNKSDFSKQYTWHILNQILARKGEKI